MTYLDHNATTPLADAAREAMLPFLSGVFANPSSAHSAGMRVKDAVNAARQQVAAMAGVKGAEVVFTGSATEATHLAIIGSLRALADSQPQRRQIVSSAIEHPSTLLLLDDLAKQGWEVTLLPVTADGVVEAGALDAAVSERTALVSLMWANNETGAIQPVAAAAEAAHRVGAVFHTDAVQAASRIAVSLPGLGADLMTLSAHKMHGPKGIGALIIRKGHAVTPLIWGHQERKRRGGTENVPGIVGFGTAAELAVQALKDGTMEQVAARRDRLEQGILALWPRSSVNGAGAPRLPNTASVRFIGDGGKPVNGEELLMRLDRVGIYVSMGAACSAGGNEPSHVLTAMGLNGAEAEASLRFSLGRGTTDDDIDLVLNELAGLRERLAA